MKGAITTNFRGIRALVMHGDDVNRDTLVNVLGRLGLDVTVLAPDALPADSLPHCDVLLFDADENVLVPCPSSQGTDIPTIALIGHETPSRLARVLGRRCDSHILKPIRSMGVFTALILAVNGHRQRLRSERELDALRQRLSGRREVMKAVLRLMSLFGIDEDTAYERLRQEAMDRRVPIEDAARDWLGPLPAGGRIRERKRMSGKA
ncbi:MAG: ANTAR domain-containing protein [Roseovarius sp.]|nr:ANTAR domain-containing protein [Roseovarius sp.]